IQLVIRMSLTAEEKDYYQRLALFIGSVLVSMAVGLCLAHWLMLRFYKFCSTHHAAVSSFILSNKDVSAWLSANDYPIKSYSFVFKTMIKIYNENIEYKDLSIDEQHAVRDFDLFVFYFNRPEDYILNEKILGIFNKLNKEHKEQWLKNPFSRMHVYMNKSLSCPEMNSKSEIAEESLWMELTIDSQCLDGRGVVLFNETTFSQKQYCTQCNTSWHKENSIIKSVAANKYFILKLSVGADIKGSTIQFKDRYFAKNEAMGYIFPSEYEVVSILLARTHIMSPPEAFYTVNKAQPLVFNDIEGKDVFYLLMKKVKS
ncbi:hypothetical protein ENBRE01_3431, partial [Enteropsectra breve]